MSRSAEKLYCKLSVLSSKHILVDQFQISQEGQTKDRNKLVHIVHCLGRRTNMVWTQSKCLPRQVSLVTAIQRFESLCENQTSDESGLSPHAASGVQTADSSCRPQAS